MAARLVLIGCGNMGYAMLQGWLAGEMRRGDVLVVEPHPDLQARVRDLGVEVHAGPQTLPAGFVPDLLVVAVKPQLVGEVLPAYTPLAQAGAAVLSVAAGTLIGTLEATLGGGVAVIRCMPNTPAAIGMGMMVCCTNARVTDETRELCTRLLATSGRVAFVEDEGLMDAVTGVSGSGPAYVFHFIEGLAAAGVAAGLPADLAGLLARQTVAGAAALAAASADDPAELRRKVTSPNGTTAAALEILMGEERLTRLLTQAVSAATERSRALARG